METKLFAYIRTPVFLLSIGDISQKSRHDSPSRQNWIVIFQLLGVKEVWRAVVNIASLHIEAKADYFLMYLCRFDSAYPLTCCHPEHTCKLSYVSFRRQYIVKGGWLGSIKRKGACVNPPHVSPVKLNWLEYKERRNWASAYSTRESVGVYLTVCYCIYLLEKLKL